MGRTNTSATTSRSRLDKLIDGLDQRGEQPLFQAYTEKETQQWPYHSVGEQVQALARGIRERTQPGESVVLIGADRPEWIIAALAVLRSGAVVTPLDVQLADDTLQRILHNSDARWVFTNAAQRERVHAAAPQAQLMLLDSTADSMPGWRALTDSAATLPDNRADATAALFYTSGTTGPPKGVPLTHRNLEFQLDTLGAAGVVHEGDRILLPLPLHHVYPFVIGMLAPILMGLTLILPHALTGPQVMRAVRDGSASVIIGVPRFYAALFEGITVQAENAGFLGRTFFRGLFRLSRSVRRRTGWHIGKVLLYPLHRKTGRQLRMLACGGSALDKQLALNLEALGWQVAVGYGLTETAPLLTLDSPGGTRLGSAGRPPPGVELRIDRQAAPPAQESRSNEGEIQARGPNVFAGYRNQPRKTEETFTHDGWFRTGDLGLLDDDGYLHITGRVSTLIVTDGGENIQPDDLEARYAGHEAIAEIGILQHNGQLVALVVPTGGVSEDSQRRIRGTIGEIARKLPSYQRLVDATPTRNPLPRTRLGKIKRHELEERYERARAEGGEPQQLAPLDIEEMSAEDRSLMEHAAARHTWDWLAQRYPKRGLTPDTRLQSELGVDSLAWLNLTMELGRRTGMELDEEAIGGIETVRDLLRELVSSAAQDKLITDPLDDPEDALDAAHRHWLQARGPLLRAVANTLYAINWLALRGLFRLQVQDRDRMPMQGPVVIACNHASYLDPFAVAAALSLARLHSLYWGGWTGVAFSNPLSRFVSRAAQVLPIDPQAGVRSSLALTASVLKQNRGLIWFPEGQRSESGELQPFRPGIGRLLDRFPAPVVAVSIHGSHEAMPPGRLFPRLCRLRVRFGTAIDSRRLAEQGQGEDAATRITEAIQTHLRALQDQATPNNRS